MSALDGWERVLIRLERAARREFGLSKAEAARLRADARGVVARLMAAGVPREKLVLVLDPSESGRCRLGVVVFGEAASVAGLGTLVSVMAH